jgi:putative phosphoribosyl transferase
MRSTSTQIELRAPLFADRAAAGSMLAEALREMLPADAVVVGLARGGVVVAAEVARTLELELDVVAVRKVGAPWQPEYALGAVAPGDGVFLRDTVGLSEDELRHVVARARRAAEELDTRLHRDHGPSELTGRVCALVDDGLATGASMVAAVRWARSRGASRVVVAVPVGARRTVAALADECASIVCLFAPEDFWAVGLWYADFGQVEDDEVRALFAEVRDRP